MPRGGGVQIESPVHAVRSGMAPSRPAALLTRRTPTGEGNLCRCSQVLRLLKLCTGALSTAQRRHWGNHCRAMQASVAAARCDLRRQLKFGLQLVVEMYVFVA